MSMQANMMRVGAANLKVRNFPTTPSFANGFATLHITQGNEEEIVLYFADLYDLIAWSEKVTHMAQEEAERVAASAQEELPLGAAFHTEG